MDQIFRSSISRVSEGLDFRWGAAGGGKRSIQKRVMCEGLARPVEIAGKPKKLMSCLNNRGESLPDWVFETSVSDLGYTRRPHTSTIR